MLGHQLQPHLAPLPEEGPLALPQGHNNGLPLLFLHIDGLGHFLPLPVLVVDDLEGRLDFLLRFRVLGLKQFFFEDTSLLLPQFFHKLVIFVECGLVQLSGQVVKAGVPDSPVGVELFGQFLRQTRGHGPPQGKGFWGCIFAL